MIKLVNNDGEITLILEPANLQELGEGKPLEIDLSRLGLDRKCVLLYVPDAVRMSIDMTNRKAETGGIIDAKWLRKHVQESVDWKPVNRAAN